MNRPRPDRLFRNAILLSCVILALPATGRAGALTLQTEFVGAEVGYFFSGFIPGTTGRAFVRVGSVLMSGAGADLGPAIDGKTFEAYCVDILGSIFDPGTPTDTIPSTVPATAAPGGMSSWTDPGGLASQPDAGSKVAWLYNTYAPGIALDPVTPGDPGTAILLAERTALQLAIWNVLYDTDLSVSDGAGSLYVWNDTTGTIVALANGYLASLGTNLDNATWLQLGSPGNDLQDFVGPMSVGTAAAVPEPASLLLLGSGVAAILARTRGRAHHRQPR